MAIMKASDPPPPLLEVIPIWRDKNKGSQRKICKEHPDKCPESKSSWQVRGALHKWPGSNQFIGVMQPEEHVCSADSLTSKIHRSSRRAPLSQLKLADATFGARSRPIPSCTD
jgi:hypothetical protein